MSRMRRALWLGVAAAPLLAGCATARYASPPAASSVVAPAEFAYARNAPAADQSRIAALLPTQDAGFVALAERASTNAPTLAAAVARIDAARALAARARAEQQPSVGANADVSGNRTSATQIGANLPPGISLNTDRISFGGQISARWDADIFGRLRSKSRAAALRVDAATADAAAIRLALKSDIATRVIDWRTLDARAAVLTEDLDAARSLLALTRTRARAGLVPEADAVRAEGLVVDAEARLAPIAGQRAAIAGQLAAIVAVPAQDVIAMLQQPAGTARYAAITSAPSALLRDRPDIAAAEFRLRAADADIEAAAARRFPNLSLSSGIGLLAFALGDIFNADALIGSLSANVAAPLLDFGRIQAEVDQRSAATQEAFAQYRGAVFTAIGESEAAFGTVAAVDAQVALLNRQVALEEDATQLATVRYRNGLSDFSRVVEARRAANATRTTLAIAQGERARSRILLWLALGGSEQ